MKQARFLLVQIIVPLATCGLVFVLYMFRLIPIWVVFAAPLLTNIMTNLTLRRDLDASVNEQREKVDKILNGP